MLERCAPSCYIPMARNIYTHTHIYVHRGRGETSGGNELLRRRNIFKPTRSFLSLNRSMPPRYVTEIHGTASRTLLSLPLRPFEDQLPLPPPPSWSPLSLPDNRAAIFPHPSSSSIFFFFFFFLSFFFLPLSKKEFKGTSRKTNRIIVSRIRARRFLVR